MKKIEKWIAVDGAEFSNKEEATEHDSEIITSIVPTLRMICHQSVSCRECILFNHDTAKCQVFSTAIHRPCLWEV